MMESMLPNLQRKNKGAAPLERMGALHASSGEAVNGKEAFDGLKPARKTKHINFIMASALGRDLNAPL